jgi:hypothetical protein
LFEHVVTPCWATHYVHGLTQSGKLGTTVIPNYRFDIRHKTIGLFQPKAALKATGRMCDAGCAWTAHGMDHSAISGLARSVEG